MTQEPIKIWVDADACPKAIKEILYKLADKRQIDVIFVANQNLHLPPIPHLQMVQVADGPDIADDEIVIRCNANDLVITADIPLAGRIVEKGAIALNPRGTIYDHSNIGQVLSMRNFMDDLRSAGVETGGPGGFNPQDKQKFANALDRYLAEHR